jgi:hypothetical protein
MKETAEQFQRKACRQRKVQRSKDKQTDQKGKDKHEKQREQHESRMISIRKREKQKDRKEEST